MNAKVEALHHGYYTTHSVSRSAPRNWLDDPANEHEARVRAKKLEYLAALHTNKSAMEALKEGSLKADFQIKAFIQNEIDAHGEALKKNFKYAIMAVFAVAIATHFIQF